MPITRKTHSALNATGTGSDLTLHLYGTSIAAIDTARDTHIERADRANELYREREKTRTLVQDIPDYNKTEARAAAMRGEAVDHAALKQRRVALIEQEAWLDLDYEAATVARDLARDDYLTAVQQNFDQLVKVAVKQRAAAEVKLQTARAMLRDAGATLDSTVNIFSLGLEVAEVRSANSRANSPRTSADNLDDGGLPSIWVSLADEPLEKALGWASRWLTYEKTVLGPRRRGESTPETEAADAADRARLAAQEAAARFAIE